MPYPLPQQPRTVGGQRVRLLPPVGCPGVEQWVLPMEFSRWADLGYRKGPIPSDDLELFWLPADSRWNEPIGSAAIELLINPRQSIPTPISVTLGDGCSNVVPWPAVSRQAPRLRHVYAQRADVTVQVQLGMLIATLRETSRCILSFRDGRDALLLTSSLVSSANVSWASSALCRSCERAWTQMAA